ncbi:hypothetical protein GWI33_022473 [Rhynchophorus ferrugineus]|uniref:Uncharacterized protein n=1 Tax=Rhynchophorus ferrugineus TaxID=354439 RepID=A0A834HN24_RHYFE|nr:hypothetical protein GWI33_022473 [Rhynchophorus ferrugineus]
MPLIKSVSKFFYIKLSNFVLVTEKNHKPDDKMVEPELFQVTTEPESEQISIARYVHRNIIKDKLIQKEEHGSDEGPRASIPLKEKKNEDSFKSSEKKPEKDREETTSKADLVEQFSPVEIRSDNKESQESSAELYDKSELNDLNQEGPYHIYHPNGSYRKTVFNAENHLTQFQLSSEVNYVPIVESIYTYDPRTFVFQRLLLRT